MLIVALPPAEPPAKVIAGVEVTWPLSKPETTLSPGAKLTVRVVSDRRKARLSFVRVDVSGKGIATVARRTLRRGSFTVRVPAGTPGARYALRIDVAGKKRFSWVTTPAAAPAPPAGQPAPAPTSQPSSPPLSFCGPDNPPQTAQDMKPIVTLGATSVTAGDTLGFTVANAGPGVFSVTQTAVLHSTPRPTSFGAMAPMVKLVPDQSTAGSLVIPADTAPGTYRLSATAQYVSCDTVNIFPATSAEFEVVSAQ